MCLLLPWKEELCVNAQALWPFENGGFVLAIRVDMYPKRQAIQIHRRSGNQMLFLEPPRNQTRAK